MKENPSGTVKIDSRFPIGSEWRRWDLHVHSPESILNSQFGNNWDRYVHELFVRAIENNISAIGITDYFFIDGYKKLKTEYLDRPEILRRIFAVEIEQDPNYLEKILSILILPNIELRIDKYVEPGSDNRLTLHIIFSNELPVEDIEEYFIKRLQIATDSVPGKEDERDPLSHSSLIRLGERLQLEHPAFRDEKTLYTGCKMATVDDTEVSELLHRSRSRFAGKYLIVLAEEYITKVNWSGSGHQARKLLYKKSHLIFSSNPKTQIIAVSDKFASEFNGKKPCIWGSDAHDFEKMFKPDKERYCWIKGDVTFNGLRQIINEPTDRCYIGECPPELAELRQLRRTFISHLAFKKKEGAGLVEQWFDGQSINLNPCMVTIIGNKGSGKSALADALALIGNPHIQQEHFSFLRNERFRHIDSNLKINRAQEFLAIAKWNTSDDEIVRSLNEESSLNDVERVRYLPQGYIEKLCNPQTEKQQKEFQQELDRVIFSHVPIADRLGVTSLEELMKVRSEEIRRAQSSLKSRIRAVNNKIVTVRPKVSDAAITHLKEKIRLKKQELERFDATKPKDVPRPAQESTESDAEIAKLQDRLRILREKKQVAEQRHAELMLQRNTSQKSLDRLLRCKQWLTDFSDELSRDLSGCGIPSNELVRWEVNTEPVERFLREAQASILEVQPFLDPENESGYEKQSATVLNEITRRRSTLNGPALLHQSYVINLEQWQKRRDELIGTKNEPDTLSHYEHQLDEAENSLPRQLDALYSERRQLLEQLFSEVRKHVQILEEYYQPLLRFIENHKAGESALSSLKVSFEVCIDGTGLQEKFLSIIHSGAIGTFSGQGDGNKQLLSRMPDGTFDTPKSAADFVEAMIEALYYDMRAGQKQLTIEAVERQFRKSSNLESALNLLCQFEYLELRTALKFADKNLHELSPGERGLLLLVFYLLLDKENIPLIIDQPEENLDNQSIKNYLVPCMKTAKRRRQLIVVTHNPNIAVVCDSEQVICCSIDKRDGYTVTYSSGSIENPQINQRIIDVLEGTLPAFSNRTQKYKTAGAVLNL